MRLLIVNWQDRTNPQAGGAELHLHEIFGRLAQRGHTIHLLCSGYQGSPAHEALDGMEIWRVGGRYSFIFKAKKFYQNFLSKNHYDLIVEDLNKVPLFTPKWGDTKVVALVHHLFGGTAFREVPWPMALLVWLWERPLGRVYKNVPFQAVSQSTKEDLIKRGIKAENTGVIYNGVDTKYLTPGGQKDPEPLFVYLGRLKRYKRVDKVIRALKQMENKESRLEIAGSGDYKPQLQNLVKKLGLENRVTFRGRITEEEKLNLLRRAWATVLASPKEGWGITNLESAACATPVIALNSPGIRESVLHGKTGYLANDFYELVDFMDRLADRPELLDLLGPKARQFALEFDWDEAATITARDLNAIAHQWPRPLISQA